MPIADLLEPGYRDYLAACASDPEAWASALHDISQKTRSRGAILFHRSTMPGTPVSRDVAEAMETYWRDEWITRDIRLRAIPVQRARGIGTDEDCVSVDEMRRSPLYNEFLARFGCKWFAGVGFSVEGNMWCLSIQRSPNQGQFRSDERDVLQRFSLIMSEIGLLNHLVAEAKTIGLTKALGLLGDWWITFDILGRRIDEGGPDTVDEEGHEPIKKLARDGPVASAVADVLSGLMRARGTASTGAGPVTLAGDGTGRVFQVRGMRLSQIHAGFGRAQYLVVLRRRERTPADPVALLQARYGLTPAEAALAVLIARGLPLREAADLRGTTYESARTQLKRVFFKCGVNRQSALAALIGTL